MKRSDVCLFLILSPILYIFERIGEFIMAIVSTDVIKNACKGGKKSSSKKSGKKSGKKKPC